MKRIVFAVLAFGGLAVAGRLLIQPPLAEPAVISSTASRDLKTQDQTNAMYAYMKGDEFDMGYLADMIAHHVGALNMVSQAKSRAKREEIRRISEQMVVSSTNEVKQMMQWQQTWNYIPTDPNNPHAGHAMEMSGLMTDRMSKMASELEAVSSDEYDELFLQTMINHQQIAVDMSKYADENAKHQELKDFSNTILKSHQENIASLKKWQ